MDSDKSLKIIHKPVLLEDVIDLLQINPQGKYIDCTLGDGSYSVEIMKHLDKGMLISIDLDEESIEFVKKKYSELLQEGNWELKQQNFSKIDQICSEFKITQVQGIIYDLGVSSRQLDSPLRGFSYSDESVLDMRMDRSSNVRACDLLKVAPASQLEKILSEYGEERYAKRIAKGIKHWIKKNPEKDMKTTDLVGLILKSVPAAYRKGRKHPARRTFQALRIAINDELGNLNNSLASALSLVAIGGRILVVSFHSLEDRIVKRLFDQAQQDGTFRVITEKPVVPDEQEINKNPRARSAKLRVIERVS